MDRTFDEMDSRVTEEIETTKFFDDLFTKIKIIIGIVGIVGFITAVVIWLK
jgi:hypothetical protein